jgi:cobalt/nickel transport system permease protein
LGAGHSHALYVHEHSPIHRLASEAKIVASFGFVVAVAVTPRESVWAFGFFSAILVALVAVSRIGAGFVALRLLAVTPFVLFAFFIPFVAGGEQVEFLGVSLSVQGLWGMWNILVKAILGASASIVLTATTEIPDIIRGLGLLRVPVVFTSIAMFMVRYLELVADDLGRMRTAMASRGYNPRWLGQARPIATAAGAMFVRTYERAERVHAAMVSRGFTGSMPQLEQRHASPREWVTVGAFIAACIGIALLALVLS